MTRQTVVYDQGNPMSNKFGLLYRWDCNGALPVIQSGLSTVIYLTNADELHADWHKQIWTTNIQFDVIRSEGLIYTSYTYLGGTVRPV